MAKPAGNYPPLPPETEALWKRWLKRKDSDIGAYNAGPQSLLRLRRHPETLLPMLVLAYQYIGHPVYGKLWYSDYSYGGTSGARRHLLQFIAGRFGLTYATTFCRRLPAKQGH